MYLKFLIAYDFKGSENAFLSICDQPLKDVKPTLGDCMYIRYAVSYDAVKTGSGLALFRAAVVEGRR